MIRSVDFISQGAAEDMPGLPMQDAVAMISISTPGTWEPHLAPFSEKLVLEFHDVEDHDEPWVVFDNEHAATLVAFVERLLDAEKKWDVVVHCKAGISRSSAVALYIESVSQCEFPRRRFAGFANRLVTKTLEAVSGRSIPVPRALIRREEFSVRVLRDFEGGLTLVTAEAARGGEICQVEGPIANESVLIGQAVEQVAGFKDPPPANQVQDWDFSL